MFHRFPARARDVLACLVVCTAFDARAGDDAALRAELDATRAELNRTRDALTATQDALAELTRRVDGLQPQAAPGLAPGAPAAGSTARLAPVNAGNPSISLVVDVQGASNTHDGDGAGFSLASGELFVSAPIDPFLRGYASINGTSDEGFDIEEAALLTTALPYGLTLQGGRFFADVGRLSKWHDEALPFVDRPPSIDRLIGGESGAEGVELSWLAPVEPFVQLTTGLYNGIGSERREEGGGFFGRRSFSELSWLARPFTALELSPSVGLELGGTFAFVPQAARRRLLGVDATLRHEPGGVDLYRGTVAGTEWFWNRERFDDLDPLLDELGAARLDDEGNPLFGPGRRTRKGGYAYLESFFAHRLSGGVRFDYAEALRDDLDRQRTYSIFASWMPSEFQRLRAQIDQIDAHHHDDQRFTLQWTAFLGSHRHGFKTR